MTQTRCYLSSMCLMWLIYDQGRRNMPYTGVLIHQSQSRINFHWSPLYNKTRIFTACKGSCGKIYVFTPVCDSVHGGERGPCPEGTLSGESLSRGVSVQGDPPCGKERTVRILLECNLVLYCNATRKKSLPLNHNLQREVHRTFYGVSYHIENIHWSICKNFIV